MSVWNSLWRSNYSFETSAYTYFEVLLQPQPLSTLLSILVSPHFSQRSNRHLFSPSRFMRRVAFQCKVGFGSTDFSLCSVDEPQFQPHRLKPVLLGPVGPADWLHEMERAKRKNEILVRNSR
jgi:hypothetical protein